MAAVYIVLILLLLVFGFNLLWTTTKCEGMQEQVSFQDAAGFCPERGDCAYPAGKESFVEAADPVTSVPTSVGKITADHPAADSDGTAQITDLMGGDWQEEIQSLGLDRTVKDSHRRYITDEAKYVNTGAAAPNMPIREDDETINPWVGLTSPMYCRDMVKDGARVVPSEDYNGLRKGGQLRWRSGYSC